MPKILKFIAFAAIIATGYLFYQLTLNLSAGTTTFNNAVNVITIAALFSIVLFGALNVVYNRHLKEGRHFLAAFVVLALPAVIIGFGISLITTNFVQWPISFDRTIRLTITAAVIFAGVLLFIKALQNMATGTATEKYKVSQQELANLKFENKGLRKRNKTLEDNEEMLTKQIAEMQSALTKMGHAVAEKLEGQTGGIAPLESVDEHATEEEVAT